MAPRVVTVFTSIPNIDGVLLRVVSSTLKLNIVKDPTLDCSFDPSSLLDSTRDALSRAEILITEPAILAKLLQDDPGCLPRLEWCQSTFAGVDPLFRANLKLPLSFRLTRFAGVFGPPIAEWCLARIIGHERKFAESAVDQQHKQWGTSVKKYRYLSDLTLTILGCGDIGHCIAKAAKAFGMKVIGYVRRNRDSSQDSGIDEYTIDLPTAIRQADYIVSVLPSTSETRGLLSGETLATARSTAGGKSPVLINVGRGDVIGEASLIHALDEGYISAAILDVFEKEPLPVDSALWDRSDVAISPHVSGITQAKDVPPVFLENYQRFVNGKDLLFQVDWSKGY
jgi:phosphoglycerate dehydrogenase-like enzyme